MIDDGRLSGTDFYSTEEWLRLRYKVIERHGNRCMACGQTPWHGIVIHVDHIKPRSKYPELALEIENMQILCDECNIGKSNLFETDWRCFYHHECTSFNGRQINEFMPEIVDCRCYQPISDFLRVQDRWAAKLDVDSRPVIHEAA